MESTTPFPWDGLLIVVLTVVTLLLGAVAVARFAGWVVSVRDELRDRYLISREAGRTIDFVVFPLWILLELFCLAGGLVFIFITVFAAYQIAKDGRDWWHEGSSRDRK